MLKKRSVVQVGLMLGAMLLVACGGGGGGASGGTAPVRTTTISTAPQGAQASFSGAQAARIADVAASDSIMAVTGGGVYAPAGRVILQSSHAGYDKLRSPLSRLTKHRLASEGRLKARAAPMAITTGTTQCVVSGSYDYTYDESLTSLDITETYHDCNDGLGEVLNGTLQFGMQVNSLTSVRVTLRFGDGDSAAEPTDFTIATYSGPTLLSTVTASLAYSVNIGGLAGTTVDYHLQVNGVFQAAFTADAANGDDASKTYSVEYDRFDTRSSWDSVTTIFTQSINGGFLLTKVDNGVAPPVTESARIGYRDFNLVSQINTAGNYQLAIDGLFSSDFTPDRCFEGTFAIKTIAPVEYDPATGQTVAGHLTINGSVHVVFNADGSVSVSTDGGTTYTTYTHAELESVCLLPLH